MNDAMKNAKRRMREKSYYEKKKKNEKKNEEMKRKVYELCYINIREAIPYPKSQVEKKK